MARQRARKAQEEREQKLQEPKQTEALSRLDYPDAMFLDEEALQLEHQRARAAAEERRRLEKKQRSAEFGVVDYSNDDNTIPIDAAEKGMMMVKVLSKRHQLKTAAQQEMDMMKGLEEQRDRKSGRQQSDSILVNRLMGKSWSGSSRTSSSSSGKLKGPLRSKVGANSMVNNYRNSSNNYKKHVASVPHDGLNNHHHHPNIKAWGS